jgi:nucleotide-binding universal stress UspA family protein
MTAAEPGAAPIGEIVVEAGDAADVVVRAARDFSADLLVIGRHNGVGPAWYLHQNAYEILRNSPCPVISV